MNNNWDLHNIWHNVYFFKEITVNLLLCWVWHQGVYQAHSSIRSFITKKFIRKVFHQCASSCAYQDNFHETKFFHTWMHWYGISAVCIKNCMSRCLSDMLMSTMNMKGKKGLNRKIQFVSNDESDNNSTVPCCHRNWN